MSKFGIKQYQHFIKLLKTNNTSPLFHTSRNSVFRELACGENSTKPDYLQCLRPATMRVSDPTAPTLAGDPRAPSKLETGIRPDVFQKWNQTPKLEYRKEWPSWWQ